MLEVNENTRMATMGWFGFQWLRHYLSAWRPYECPCTFSFGRVSFWEQQISDCFDIYEYNLPKNPVSRGILKVNIADVKQKYLKNVTDKQGIST